jgi:tRNA(fMet)-specific endonuclease VapC
VSAFLLDTNVLSELMKPRPDRRVVRAFERHEADAATASPVWHELVFGCRRLSPSRRRRELLDFLTEVVGALPVLSYDQPAADWHAQERVRLTKLGRMPAFVDGQIAAIAKVNGLTLVTRNRSDFVSFEVDVASWFS